MTGKTGTTGRQAYIPGSPGILASQSTKRLDNIAKYTLVKSSRIYTGQYTLPILLLNDDNMLGEHKGREKNIVYGRLF